MADGDHIDELVNDLAYTVMVFRRASLDVTNASLVLLSRNFRFGDGPDRLFETVDVTADAMARAAEFDAAADGIAKLVFQGVASGRPPDGDSVSTDHARPRRLALVVLICFRGLKRSENWPSSLMG